MLTNKEYCLIVVESLEKVLNDKHLKKCFNWVKTTEQLEALMKYNLLNFWRENITYDSAVDDLSEYNYFNINSYLQQIKTTHSIIDVTQHDRQMLEFFLPRLCESYTYNKKDYLY